MPIRLFEALCLATVTLTLILMGRSASPRVLRNEYFALAVSGFVGEESMIYLYRFYGYASSWDARLLDVPVIVPLIWPLVVLSARDLVEALTKGSNASGSVVLRALLIGGFVTFDASLVEVVRPARTAWSWAEPGHLGVPLIGILGWGFFAFGASIPLIYGRDRSVAGEARPAWTYLASIVLGPLAAHLLIQLTWWAVFRSPVRGPLASTPRNILLAGAVPLGLAILVRARGLSIPIGVAAPRMVAALLFVALLVVTAASDRPLWASAAVVALPYLCLTRFRGALVPQHPDREFC